MNETNQRDEERDNNDVSLSSKRFSGAMDSHRKLKWCKKRKKYTDDELCEVLETRDLKDWAENRHLFQAAFQRFTLRCASDEVKNHKEIVSLAVTSYGLNLAYASAALQNDREVVALAVTGWGCALRYSSQELQNDKEIVLLAVSDDGEALEYASEELQNDRDIVMSAFTNNSMALEYASEECQNDRDFVIAAVTNNGWTLGYVSYKFQNDRDIVMAAVKNDGCALEYASDELQNDSEIVSLAIAEDVNALQHASLRLRSDKQIAMLALEQCDDAFVYTDRSLWNDPEIIAAAASHISTYVEGAEEVLGPVLKKRLLHINKALETENELPSLEDVIRENGIWGTFAEQKWRMPAYETIWLLNKSYDEGLPDDVKKSIVGYSGLDASIHLANELGVLAFLYHKFAQSGWHWNDIPCNDGEVSND